MTLERFCTSLAHANTSSSKDTYLYYGLLHLTLDVPDGEQLLAWGTALHQPLAGHVTFYETNRLTARETVGFAAGECVGYEETFVSGEGADGAYVCRLTIAAEKLQLTPGGPARAFVPAAAREYVMPVAAALLAENSKSRELPSSMASKPALFRDSTWGVEPASPELVKKISERRRVVIAQPGSDDLAYLDSPFVMAEASCNDHDYQHILIRENPSKAALLEEFFHGTQQRLGLIDKLGRGGAERHVKDFMIRHQKILGLGTEDVEILNVLMNAGL